MEYIVLVITLIVLIMNIIILVALSKNKDKSGADVSLMISEKIDKTRDEIIDEILDENKENTAIFSDSFYVKHSPVVKNRPVDSVTFHIYYVRHEQYNRKGKSVPVKKIRIKKVHKFTPLFIFLVIFTYFPTILSQLRCGCKFKITTSKCTNTLISTFLME